MVRLHSKMYQLFEEQRSVHVLYPYVGLKNYISTVVDFVLNGIMAGDYVILIENERDYRLIHRELSSRLTFEQFKFLHRVNNFDFYFTNGSYQPPAILEYFNKTVQPYLDRNLSFRTWAHVEWASVGDPLHLIEDIERTADEKVKSLSFPLICAYEAEQMPIQLQTILFETHPYILLEENFISSELYSPLVDV
ncbi:MEDS domain-containing protein [Sutcliffiella horikoshii]|uniref:MEDS domain-containing protein n=1 Tax=Sutcliffiella horikoshii TaxID=79883 RepID=UPI003144EAAD